MFSGAPSNPYDEIVGKTTDENLTSENWELIMNLCDKVMEEGTEGARNVIAAILKRLAHRNPNVQLYALSLAESLSKNCGVEFNREIASRAFTQGLEKLITDRNTHDKVKKRALALIIMWTADFEKDSSLGVMEDCYNSLKGKGFKFETPQEPLPPTVDDDIRRKEEEELQRVLQLSMEDKGGRGQWSQYSHGGSSSSQAATSSSQARPAQPATASTPQPAPSNSAAAAAAASSPSRSASLAYKKTSNSAPSYPGGYAPAKTPSPEASTAPVHQHQPQQQQHQSPSSRHRPSHSHTQPQPQQQPQPQSHHQHQHQHQPKRQPSHQDSIYQQPSVSTTSTASSTSSTTSVATPALNAAIVTRVRALHAFEPTEPGELAFEKGDVIRVVDRGYQDWWRGQLKGRTGIFPVNYVEPMPEPTAGELAKEAEQEAAVFGQAVNVEKLLNMLKSFDPATDNLADDEEIQELYRSCMALRPKIVKLIDKYSQKRADLVSMNETFVKARTIFDRMMEESLARHTGLYDSTGYGSYVPANDPRTRLGSPPIAAGPQAFGWAPSLYEQPGYNLYPSASTPYPPQHPQHDVTPVPFSTATPAPGGAPLPVSGPSPGPGVQPYGAEAPPYAHQAQGPGYPPQAAYQYQTQMGNAPYAVQTSAPYPTQPTQATGQPPPAQTSPPSQNRPQQAQAAPPQVQHQAYNQDFHPQQYAPPTQAPPQGYHSDLHGQQQQQQQQQQPQQVTHSPTIQSQVPQNPAALPQTQTQPQLLPIDTADIGGHIQPAQQYQPPVQVVQVETQSPTQAQEVLQTQTQPQTQPNQQPQAQALHSAADVSNQAQPQTGPPYVFDPHTTYTDPNVQAWAQYYAQGGTDAAGAVYFFSVPGVKEASPAPQQAQDQFAYQQTQANTGSTGSLGAASAATGSDNTVTSPVDVQSHQHIPQSSYSSLAAAAAAAASAYAPPATTPPAATGAGAGVVASMHPMVTGQTDQSATQQPSWVIPKKGGANPAARAASPSRNPAQQAGPSIMGGYATNPVAQPYHSLPNQFAGMSVADHH